MPNGDVSGGGVVPSLELDIPGIPEEATSFGALFQTALDFFSGLFGGRGPQLNIQTPAEAKARLQAFRASQDPDPIPGRAPKAGFTFIPGTSIVTGRIPIPLPEQGGPELVTERFRNLPPIPDVPEFVEGPLGFEGITDMPVDVPLLSSFLPAVRQVATPTVSGFIGGIAQDIVSGLFARPLGELGLGQVPMRQPAIAAQPGLCPPEKPSTRILRFIKQNTGVSINLSRAKSLIRQLGLENAARCLGITAQEVCQLLIVASPRRRRGISGSDIRIVKRTARRFEALKHDLGHFGRAPTHHRRKHVHAHAHK